MKKSFKSAAIVLLAIIAGAGPVQAEYNSNVVGTITNVLTYDGGHFLFTLSAMPSSPCANYFIVPSDIPVDGRQMLLSRALMAKASGEAINIGYDNKTCVNGWYRVHRIG
ncbi:hypothetical protein [Sphingomonas phyllosphaerae]|uniref:hypothetical protein n=1 Tax=Sphingomonas phyllosphaerae TaxID=257003 RepID=UPI0012DC4417|nr:hypothetical protein [Sphingomonas phyllosphaerae]